MGQSAVRLQIWAEWLLLATCSLVLAFHTMPSAWRTLNTDFPNYYLAAQLVHQHYDVTHAYEWRWLQREKDHRTIDQPIIGLAPITPFSTLFIYPLTGLRPLPAKHLWLMLQLALLVPVSLALRSLTGQPLRRIALLTAACQPLHRNLLYGQFYILLLAMLVAACWAYRHQLSSLSGVLIGIAAMTKIFPVVFLLYFLRKRDWRALFAAIVTLAVTTGISIAVFGWSLHRTYLQVVLPWTLRGENLPPYLLVSASLSTLLHRLFVYEPQWNPHPWHTAPLLAAVLAPVLQTLLLAPALLLIRPREKGRGCSPLEWSVLLSATLAISTSPASYDFTLLIFPVAVLCGALRTHLAFVAVVLFLAIGYSGWNNASVDGLHAMLHVPRLFFLIAFTVLTFMASAWHGEIRSLTRTNYALAASLAVYALISIVTAVRHQRGLFADYPYRLPMQPDAFFSAQPIGAKTISLLPLGYRLTPVSTHQQFDQLSFASSPQGNWIEEVRESSTILPPPGVLRDPILNARAPVLSPAGELIAYVRDQRGAGRLYAAPQDIPLTPASLNVEEAAYLSPNSFLVAATSPRSSSQLFITHPGFGPEPLGLGEARYPALSPDARYLAYSSFTAGAWNLWLLDLLSHKSRRLTHADCNQVEPAWESDSKTLRYASDCGRALGFTAICRRQFIP